MPRHTYFTTCSTPALTYETSTSQPPRRRRITIRYDRARNNLDRHVHYTLAAYMASDA